MKCFPSWQPDIKQPIFRMFPVTFTWEFPDKSSCAYTVQMIQYEGRPAFTLDAGLMTNQRKAIEQMVNEQLQTVSTPLSRGQTIRQPDPQAEYINIKPEGNK